MLYATILTLAPAARARSWDVVYNWSHWVGFIIWCLVFILLLRQVRHFLPDADPYFLPITSLLTGLGMLSIWRLLPYFGMRQAAWLLLSGLVIALGIRLGAWLNLLRRFKYVFLTVGIFLTTLTLIFGTNPEGSGLNLWLGCCGIYLQPSEPLKLLFLIYLSAYLADFVPLKFRLVILITPTVIITGLAILLLLVQRDLGTASIFIFLYSIMLYLASGRKRLLIISLAGLLLAGIAGYYLFDVVRLRVDGWLNPWLDPSGRSFQIIQSLMAIANGGVGGRGPGMGNPGLVPVSISDFIYTAIAEETGLAGTIALLSLYVLFAARGMLTALRASDNFRRLLAAGLTLYIGAQSILIIGGNTRLLPLTGVTLPFVSYGGSSLLTSFLALGLILVISNRGDLEPAPLTNPQPFQVTAALLGLGFLALSLTTGWWALWRSDELLGRTDNARRTIADRYVRRGSLLDRNEIPINLTEGVSGSYSRIYAYPDLSSILGYTNPTYGQAGLEASLDDYLRGLRGNPASLVWIDHLLYGQPPPGLDVRLTIDLELQDRADALLSGIPGAVVLLNAETGEVLAIASHPTFDANLLDQTGDALLAEEESPLLNRAAQAAYPSGNILEPFLYAAALADQGTTSALENLYSLLGFYSAPELFLPVTEASQPGEPLRISPLQMALAAATLSSGGQRPAPLLAGAVKTITEGWVILPVSGEPVIVFPQVNADLAAEYFILEGTPFWQYTVVTGSVPQRFSWSIGGTLPDWQGSPIVVAVLLEKESPNWAGFIGRELLEMVTRP